MGVVAKKMGLIIDGRIILSPWILRCLGRKLRPASYVCATLWCLAQVLNVFQQCNVIFFWVLNVCFILFLSRSLLKRPSQKQSRQHHASFKFPAFQDLRLKNVKLLIANDGPLWTPWAKPIEILGSSGFSQRLSPQCIASPSWQGRKWGDLVMIVFK